MRSTLATRQLFNRSAIMQGPLPFCSALTGRRKRSSCGVLRTTRMIFEPYRILGISAAKHKVFFNIVFPKDHLVSRQTTATRVSRGSIQSAWSVLGTLL